jgi:UDP:flavonoid glycosyltransferase YjiC (YdhE family)
MRVLLFAVAAYNLSETTRLVEIAKACRGRFKILFASYGGAFERLILEAGFPLRVMEPRLSQKKIEHLYRCIRGETLHSPFTRAQLKARVTQELALFREIQPAAVITGFCLSMPLSCRLAQIPLVWVVTSTWMRPYFQAGLATWPDALDFPWLRWIPDRVLNGAARYLVHFNRFLLRAFYRTARQLKIPPFRGMEFWEGDYTLLTEPPEFTGLNLPPPKFHYVGPIITKLNSRIPPEITRLPRDRPVIYFAMGSSGNREIIAAILEGFRHKPYHVIAPVKAHLAGRIFTPAPNVLVTDWLPAHQVNPLADISVIHGGIGTVMTACLSGTPIVGVGMQPEQEANLECLVRKGFAIRLRKKRLTASGLLTAIETLLHNPEARQRAREFQKILEKYDGPAMAAEFLERTFGP